MFDQGRLYCYIIGLFVVIQISSSHHTGAIRTLGAFCANNTKTGEPNLNPIDDGAPRLLNKVENGTLYQMGSGDDQIYLLHVYGDSGYDFGYAYGTLLKDQIRKVLDQAWKHFEQEVMDALKSLKLPQWLEDMIVNKGLAFALDFQNTLVERYMDPEIYNEMRGISDAAQIDYKMVVRVHMLGEITRGKFLSK